MPDFSDEKEVDLLIKTRNVYLLKYANDYICNLINIASYCGNVNLVKKLKDVQRDIKMLFVD